MLSPGEEWQRFVEARQRVDDELARLGQVGNALISDIFHVHREILHDKTLTESVRAGIDDGASASEATLQATSELVRIFQSLSDEYFASRSADIRDVGQRILAHLGGVSLASQLSNLPPGSILVADDLTPYDTTHLDRAHTVGIALAGSAPTAHTSILARSFGLALVCGIGPNILQLKSGASAVVDGVHGRLLVDPDTETLETYRATQKRLNAFRVSAEAKSKEEAKTLSGVRVPVRANINSVDDLVQLVDSGADGIGLLRTEFLFQQRTTPPSVEEQLKTYRRIAGAIGERVLTVRLLDIGGDKPVQYLPQPAEANPFLGVRGIRLLLQNPDLLASQLTALVRLALEETHLKQVRILVPMVSKVNEIFRVATMLEEIPGASELRYGSKRLALGTMIEVPAAAMLADQLAKQVEFFSIGTNDLAQYTLAADRVNSAVASLASPLDPSVLRLIQRTALAGAEASIPVTLCGEMGGDPSLLPLLIGLGVKEVSVVPPAVPLVKHAVRQVDNEAAERLASIALNLGRSLEVHELLTAAT